MIENPMVSVSVVTYQHVNYIKQCLDGILMQQTTFPFEIVLGEDESTDGTRDICIAYAKKYPDIIKLFLRKRQDVIYIDGHPTGRFNFTENLKICRGKYIALCEGDDYWTDSLKLQKQVDFLEQHPDYVVSCHNASVVDQDGNLISESRLGPDLMMDFTSDELICGRHMLTLSLCFRNVIHSLPPIYFKSAGGDTFLISLLGQYGHSKYQGDIKNGVYRIHSGGVWNFKNNLKQRNSQRRTYLNMSRYYKNRHQMAYDHLFKKYFNVSKVVIDEVIKTKAYHNMIIYFAEVSWNCMINGYYRKVLHLLKFTFTTFNSNLTK